MDDALEALVSRIRQAMQAPDAAAGAPAGPTATAPTEAAAPDGPSAESEAPSFEGRSTDGAIVARVDARGRVLALDIDQSLARTPSTDIAAGARDAINAALAARPRAVDLSPIVDTLRQSQEQARAELSSIVAGINQAVIRVTEGRQQRPPAT